MRTLRRAAIVSLLPLMTALVAASPAGPATAAGASTPAKSHRLVIPFGANKSNNWSGYNQGTVEQGSKLFNQISGDWNVPTATQHTAGQAEYSSSWIGIGGGCIDAGCTATDATLIQTGTEQDVAANGTASYSAWWELMPAPRPALGVGQKTRRRSVRFRPCSSARPFGRADVMLGQVRIRFVRLG